MHVVNAKETYHRRKGDLLSRQKRPVVMHVVNAAHGVESLAGELEELSVDLVLPKSAAYRVDQAVGVRHRDLHLCVCVCVCVCVFVCVCVCVCVCLCVFVFGYVSKACI